MMKIPIFFTFNDGYVNPAAVAFFSLLNRAKEDVFFEMFVLHHDISEEHRKMLQDVVARAGRGSLRFMDTGGFLDREWRSGAWGGNQDHDRFTADAVVRCFAARFFPQYDRIIYSDVDVVFVDDVSELWRVDLADTYFAGVRNVFLKHLPAMTDHLRPDHYRMLGDSYVDGGLWVMNLKRIREDALEDRMLEIIRDDSIVKRWNDMDVMNIACANNVTYLPLNYICRPHLPEALATPGFTSHFTRDEIFDAVLRPKIVHYAGRKPWAEKMEWGFLWWNIADYLELDVKRPTEKPQLDGSAETLAAAVSAKRRYRLLAATSLLVALVSAGLLIARVLTHG